MESSVSSLSMRQFLLKNLEGAETGGVEWRINLRGIRNNYASLTCALEPGRGFRGATLLLRGGKSDYVADEDVEAMRALFPALELETIQGAGHWVHAEER